MRRRKIKLIRQRDKRGCAIACVAMLAGVTYSHAKKVWVEQCRGDDPPDGLTVSEMVFLLEKLGNPECSIVPGPAIVFIDGANGRHGHAIVVTERGKLLDPEC